MKTATIAKIERWLRPAITQCSPQFVVRNYSKYRKRFLERLTEESIEYIYKPSHLLARKLWGLHFRTPLLNAAGMFKNGECYQLMFQQGAGGYLFGTTTVNQRNGNEKDNIHTPFVPYPRSHAASNWLGLPNKGDEEVVKKIYEYEKSEIFPIGASVMASPDLSGKEQLKRLAEGMRLYDKAGVNFLEMNESCPNTKHQQEGLKTRLQYIKNNFLDKRIKEIPVIVKFSNDTKKEKIPPLLDMLFDLEYDGVNFGNTSTNYEEIKKSIHLKEQILFDYFTKNFGGGVSGKPLKEKSLELCATAVEYLKKGSPWNEFHVTRTGGINSPQDIHDSDKAGVSLNQWFTGYFEQFAQHGHALYQNFFAEYGELF